MIRSAQPLAPVLAKFPYSGLSVRARSKCRGTGFNLRDGGLTLAAVVRGEFDSQWMLCTHNARSVYSVDTAIEFLISPKPSDIN